MFQQHEVFQPPEPEDSRIWRYLDFAKFVSLLETKSLFFCRLDKLGDPFEGSLPKISAQTKEKFFAEVKANYNWTADDRPMMETFVEEQRKWTAVNCWHCSNHESAAMWSLYLKSNEGVAIQSTYERLIASVSDEERDIYIGLVKYLDFDKDEFSSGHDIMGLPNLLEPLICKRKSFEHERELRAVIWKPEMVDRNQTPWENGLYIGVALERLIERIFVCPASTEWFSELVESVTRAYGYPFDVGQSDLQRSPIF